MPLGRNNRQRDADKDDDDEFELPVAHSRRRAVPSNDDFELSCGRGGFDGEEVQDLERPSSTDQNPGTWGRTSPRCYMLGVGLFVVMSALVVVIQIDFQPTLHLPPAPPPLPPPPPSPPPLPSPPPSPPKWPLPMLCLNSCRDNRIVQQKHGTCEDGGTAADGRYGVASELPAACPYGTDCADCANSGARTRPGCSQP